MTAFSPLCPTISQSLLKFMSLESLMLSNHLILCCSLLLLPSIFLSIGIFSSELALHVRWPKYWSFSFSISPSSEYSGLISFRIDWLDLLSVQGMLKNYGAEHHSSKASILALTLLYDSTVTSVHNFWKKHSLDYMDLCWQSLVSVLSRFVIAFLPRTKPEDREIEMKRRFFFWRLGFSLT